MSEREAWKPVYPARYEASSLGRIRSVDRVGADGRRWRGKVLKQAWWERYWHVCLSFDGRKKFGKAHVLVAKAFLGECPSGKEVNHIDGDKRNTRSDNLEYVTHKGNGEHAARSGLRPTKKNGKWRRKWRP